MATLCAVGHNGGDVRHGYGGVWMSEGVEAAAGPRGRGSRVSMADVARRAGVSSQTVSRVSNGSPSVVPQTRERVLAAMRELGYRPNSAARALKRGEFRTLGVIVFTLSTTGNVRTLEAIATSAAQEGYAITLIPVAVPTQDEVLGAFTRLGELAVDAVIVIMEVHLLDAADFRLPPGLQVVVADSEVDDRYGVVDTDQISGSRDAVEHLLGLGHRTVHHLAGPAESFFAERRARAWRQTLQDRGCAVPAPVNGDWSAESGYRVGQALAADPECTAVFAANDQMALGLLRALHERGRSVPGDVSVVGFDDIAEAGSFLPPLTTIRQDFAEVGRRLVAKALRRLRGEAEGSGATLVPTELVVRASTAPPRG
ncbi:LacI family DNA-binding transcriptional regulator [Nocardiopsis valliformis]|uniref:LacI family DNA-binding transcriptional regulator n=1 Tax=Nocardiopsis valliformis TaxID=239974 RepID=UPI001EF9F29D|nr:LacI family DNA-binding transcriptional regulator [Nocardiopsis valliformis]